MKRIILLIMLLSMITMSAMAAVQITEEDLPLPAITIEKAVNVRSSASANGKIIEKLAKGTEVMITGLKQAKDGTDYFSVQLSDEKEGFVRADLLAYGEEYDALVAAGAVVTPKPTTAGKSKSSGSSSKSSGSSSTSSGSGTYIGNKNSKVFHRSSCSRLPGSKNRVKFSSRDKAISAGYKPCSVCKP